MVTIPDTDLGEMIQMILPRCLQLVHTHSLHQWWTRENQLWKYRNDLYWKFERICLNLCREVYIAFKVESWMIDPPWTISSLDNDDLRCWIQLKYVNISATSSMVLSPAVSILHSDGVHLITCPEIYFLNWNCKNIINYFLPQFNGCDHSIQVNFSSISPLTSSIACKVRFWNCFAAIMK